MKQTLDKKVVVSADVVASLDVLHRAIIEVMAERGEIQIEPSGATT